MTQRLLHQKAYLDKYEEVSELEESKALSKMDWKVMREVVAMLEPFHLITKYLQFKTRSVSSCTLPFLTHIQGVLSKLKRGLGVETEIGKQVEIVTITTVLRKQMIKRLYKRFLFDFECFIDCFKETDATKVSKAVLNQDKHHLAIMWLDPRTRVWIEQRTNVHYHNLMKEAAMNLVTEQPEERVIGFSSEILGLTPKKKKRSLAKRQISTRNSPVKEVMSRFERHKAKFAHMNVAHSPVSPVSSETNLSPEESAVNRYTTLTTPAWNVFESFYTGSGEEKQEEDPLCPFKWWNKQLKVDPSLKPIAQAAFKALTIMNTSTFSEQHFTSAKISTSGQRARTGVVALNRRQFVKYNFQVVSKEFNVNRFNLHDKAGYYGEKVANLLKRYELDIESLELEEEMLLQHQEDQQDNFSVSTLASTFVDNFSTSVEKWCLSCHHYSLVKKNINDFKVNTIRCSMDDCKRATKRVKPNEDFYMCTNCTGWDMCIQCYNE